MKLKNLLLNLGSTSIIVGPIAAVIACSSGEEISRKITLKDSAISGIKKATEGDYQFTFEIEQKEEGDTSSPTLEEIKDSFENVKSFVLARLSGENKMLFKS